MLLTGVSGLLGNNLAFCLRGKYDILGVYCTHKIEIDGIRTAMADIASARDMCALIKDFKPEIIIHCAAHADVEVCEENQEETERINVFGTRNLVNSLNSCQAKLVYISTDLVYDGEKGYFNEDDRVNPLNCYGKSKYKGEQEALKARNSLILRTNFFGWNILDKFSLGEWVIHELTHERTIRGFEDCLFSSIYTFELAKILDSTIQKDLSGLYNCGSSTFISKYQFALDIADKLGFDKTLVKPISVDEFGFKAKRGKNLALNTSKLVQDIFIDIPPISYSIDRFVEDFKKGIPETIKSNRPASNIYSASPKIIPYGRQCIDEEDIVAVVDVLKSNSITQGPKVQEFEEALCKVTDASFAVTVNSGTSALHLACLAAAISPGDEVITSPNTFVASANCIVYCHGKPVFADIDSRTYNISSQEIEKKINKYTKAVIPVHFAGQSCDMETIQKVVTSAEKKYGHKIYIIEDACHALGSRYKESKVGSCMYSDMAVMSFHPVKHITTGEGGCVLTNDEKLFKKLVCLRSHGITSDPADTDAERQQMPWYYEQRYLGYNYRITNIQCALGTSQLKKLDRFRQERRAIVNRYNEVFKEIKWLKTPLEIDYCTSNFHLYVLLIDFVELDTSRVEFMLELRKNGIGTQVHYIPVHTQPFYRNNFETNWGDCPQAESFYKKCLSIPLYPTMSDMDVKKVIDAIKRLSNK